MFSVRLKAPVKSLLATVLVASLGGFGAVHAAETGASATGGSAPPPITINPAPAMPVPVGPKTPPSAPMAAPTVPKPASAATPSAPVADIPGNPDGSCPASAPVKVSKSKIYHVPDETNYKNTKAKHCFASAQAAEQAGYRAPKK
jgi:hypothetical protein